MSESDGWPTLLDGVLHDSDSEALTVCDPSVQLAASLFETLALRGEPRLVDAHLDRLIRSARSIGLAHPAREVMARGLAELARALPVDGAALRLCVSPRAAGEPHWWIAARALPQRPAPTILWPAGPCVTPGGLIDQVKHGGRRAMTLLREEAQRRGAFDALLGTTDGDLAETTVANLWIVIDGRLRTPPAIRGCLPGVVRAAILGDRGGPLPSEVTAVQRADLERATEVLVTNSLHGPLGVDGVLGWREDLPGASGTVAVALAERFRVLESR